MENNWPGTSLVAQWLRIRLPAQETRFDSWSGKIPHAAKQQSPCTTTTEPVPYNPRATATEARAPRARAPQQEKPPQWEARARQQRVAPARRNYRKPVHSNKDAMQPKINK